MISFAITLNSSFNDLMNRIYTVLHFECLLSILNVYKTGWKSVLEVMKLLRVDDFVTIYIKSYKTIYEILFTCRHIEVMFDKYF